MSANFAGGSNTDVNGHGTAIAGIAAASAWGVSRSATVYGVKVFNDNGSATTSVIVQGFNFVIQDAPSRNCPNGVFVNFAGAGGFSRALNVVAASVVSAGHFVSVDAGLGGVNVVNVSPASEPTVCTVGSTDRTDTVPSTSNFGAIDIYAPGFGVTSLRPTGGTVSFLLSSPLFVRQADSFVQIGSHLGTSWVRSCCRSGVLYCYSDRGPCESEVCCSCSAWYAWDPERGAWWWYHGFQWESFGLRRGAMY